MWRKRNSFAVDGNVKWCSYVENSKMAPQKIQQEMTISPRNSIFDYILKRNETRDSHTCVYSSPNHYS